MHKENLHLPDNINRAIDMLLNSGYKAYAVGGCVRDMLMGIKPHDFDITTSSKPEETIAVFSDFYTCKPTGIEHGTITVYIDDEALEITTFRKEGKYSDHRHPDCVSFTDKLEEDLVRRDFTMNALAFNEHDGLVDLFGGALDIESGIIRTVGEPSVRFDEDAIRMLRAVRFASKLGFKIEKSTEEAIHRLAPLVSLLAKERRLPEFSALICGKNAEAMLREYSDVIFEIIPELKAEYNCSQNSKYHRYDVWEHSLRAVSNVPQDFELRFAALLHDIGKPGVKRTDSQGFDHFKGHVELGVEIADKILDSFGITAESKKIIHYMLLHHEERIPLTKPRIKLLLMSGNEGCFRRLQYLQLADNLSKTEEVAGNRGDCMKNAIILLEEIKANKEPYTLKELNISGKDIQELGAKGKNIGILLDNLLLDVIYGNLPNEKAALTKAAPHILAEIEAESSFRMINLKEECTTYYKKFGNERAL